MLKTHLFRGSTESSSVNKRKRYLRVSPVKKLSILSFIIGLLVSCTLFIDEYPPAATRVWRSNAWKISQPQSRYCWSLVRRYNTNSDSTVSGLSRLCRSAGWSEETRKNRVKYKVFCYFFSHLNNNVAISISLIEVRNFRAQSCRHFSIHLITCVH